MIRCDFIKYCFGALSTFCLTGSFNKFNQGEDYYFQDICLGKYKSHTISYNLEREDIDVYLGDIKPYFRCINFPTEYTLNIKYSKFEAELKSYNINQEDISEIISKKPKELLIKDNKIILNCKNKKYQFNLLAITISDDRTN